MGTPPIAPVPGEAKKNILDILKDLLPQMTSLAGGGGGPAGGGGASPLISPGMPGQVPPAPPVPQVAGAGSPGSSMAMGLPGRTAGPIGPATQTPMPARGQVNNPLFQTGFEFSSPQGRNAAVVSSAIQGVTQFIGKAKERKDAKTKRQAENYMSQITAAQQSGDQETLNLLLEDPKIIKTLEKGLDYIMPKVPGEPPPPEAVGVKSALDKMVQMRLPAPNTPGGVAIPRQPQSVANQRAMADITSGEALKAVQADPTLARAQGLGTTLSGEELRKSEQWAAGLGISPAQQAKMNQEDRKIAQAFQVASMQNETALKEILSREKISEASTKAEIEAAKIHAGPMYERARLLQQMAKDRLEYQKALASGSQKKANDIALRSLTSQITNLRTLQERAAKDGKDDLVTQYKTEADSLQKTYDEILASQQMDIDKIVKEILGPE